MLIPDGAEAFRRATAPRLRAVRELFIDALTPDQLLAAVDLATSLRARLASSRAARWPSAALRTRKL